MYLLGDWILSTFSIFPENMYLPGDYIFSRGELNDHVIYIVSGQALIIGGGHVTGEKRWSRGVSENQVV